MIGDFVHKFYIWYNRESLKGALPIACSVRYLGIQTVKERHRISILFYLADLLYVPSQLRSFTNIHFLGLPNPPFPAKFQFSKRSMRAPFSVAILKSLSSKDTYLMVLIPLPCLTIFT